MKQFDLYYAWPPKDSFSRKQPVAGKRYWLDGCDGFDDQYFDGCDDQIRFVVLIPDQSLSLIPSDQAAFEAIPFIEVTVITRDSTEGVVEVTKKQTLGAWMRSVDLSNSPTLADLPFNEEQEREICATLLKKVPIENWALWKAPTADRPALRNHLSAICIFKTEKGTRCLVLRDNAVPSMIFQINDQAKF